MTLLLRRPSTATSTTAQTRHRRNVPSGTAKNGVLSPPLLPILFLRGAEEWRLAKTKEGGEGKRTPFFAVLNAEFETCGGGGCAVAVPRAFSHWATAWVDAVAVWRGSGFYVGGSSGAILGRQWAFCGGWGVCLRWRMRAAPSSAFSCVPR